ncbi:MAG: LEA type 2 family protein [Chitinophagaceae bacterium]|nr:LEA type 2 family protein [Chitinophagaceae bacterium]
MNPANNIRYTVLYLFATAILLSCSTPKALEYRDFKNFTIEKLGFASSYIKMDMVYFNPNDYGLQLKRTDLDIFINDVYLGHTAQEYQITIPRKDTFAIPLKIEVDMKNLLKNGVNLLFLNEVTVKVTGSVKVGKANVFMGFPVKYEGRQVFTMF